MKHPEKSHKVPHLEDPNLPMLKLGLCQIHTVPFDFEGNRERTLAALEEAGKSGSELAITPECVLTGYGFCPDLEETMSYIVNQAITRDDPFLEECAAIARKHRMAIAVGYAEKEGDLYYNATTLFNRDGVSIAHYRKVHLRDFESIRHRGFFTAGDNFPVVDLETESGTWKVGIMICFDREIAESVRCLRAQGAELIICPLACDTCPMDVYFNYVDNESVTRVRAAENEVFIAVVNHAGRFNGGTFVVGPAGDALVQFGEKAEFRQIDLPLQESRTKFRAEPLGWMGWDYLRPEIYKKYS